MVVGAEDGFLHYYKNVGTHAEAVFSLVSNAWSGIDFSRYAAQGSTLCSYFYSYGGKKYMLLGLYDGTVSRYMIENGTATICEENILGYRVGKNATPAYFITKQAEQYIAVGNAAGGLSLFCYGNESKEEKKAEMSISPNPSSDYVFILLKEDKVEKWNMYDVSGRKVLSGSQSSVDIKKTATRNVCYLCGRCIIICLYS